MIRREFFGAIERIKKSLNKKLGSNNQMEGDLENAFDIFESSNASNIDGFRKPIQSLLEDYYDPMYDYQMNKRQGEILFQGNMEELVKFAENYLKWHQ